MNDLVKFAALFVIAVLVLALLLRIMVGFITALVFPLVIIAALIVVGYLFLAARNRDE